VRRVRERELEVMREEERRKVGFDHDTATLEEQ
jgi:hypothetical protein